MGTTWQQGYDVARAINAKAYIQTSAKTYQGILEGDDGMKGGKADTQVDPDGVWLKSKICELRAHTLANHEVPVVKKVEAAAPAKPPTPAANPQTPAANPQTPAANPQTPAANPQTPAAN